MRRPARRRRPQAAPQATATALAGFAEMEGSLWPSCALPEAEAFSLLVFSTKFLVPNKATLFCKEDSSVAGGVAFAWTWQLTRVSSGRFAECSGSSSAFPRCAILCGLRSRLWRVCTA